MRAMFESFEANRFKATGIIQWMYNASWPKLWWQLYDYYLMPTGAFYGARKACEPIHIAYNYGTHSVEAFNNTLSARKGLSCDIGVYDASMHKVFEKQITLNDLAAQSTQPLLGLPENLELSSTYFLDLRLYDSLRHVISTNFYALSTKPDKLDEGKSTWYITPQSDYADLKLLQQLPAVHLNAQTSISQREDTTFVQVELKNPSKQLAFMVHLDLKNKAQGESVTPIFWDDNYLSLLPGEERTISGYCHTGDLKGQPPVVEVTGWNVQ
jgi:exo-1,4-beta-D-glucosaminidase